MVKLNLWTRLPTNFSVLAVAISCSLLNSSGSSACSRSFNSTSPSTAGNHVATQEEIRTLVQSRNPKRETYQKKPVFAFPLHSSQLEDYPKVLRTRLGSLDQTKYGQKYLEMNIGSVIVIQVSDPKPGQKVGEVDIYPMGKSTYDESYTMISNSEVNRRNPSLRKNLAKAGLTKLFETGAVFGILKPETTEMIRLSEIGFSKEDSFGIEAPWGDIQLKTAKKDGFLAINPEGDFYLVNADGTGLPTAYYRVD